MHDPQFDNAPSGNYPARVELKTSRGTYVADVHHARGSAEFPLSETELEDKFVSCASTSMPVERADSLLSAILESSYGTELRELENLLIF
jgi:2-methylcitrate dehydratase PrpD